MRRFRPRSPRPGRLWPWLVLWLALVVAYLIWVGWPQNQTEGATLNQATTRSAASLTVSYTGRTWQKKPVYLLQNRGRDLKHVNVYNWAEDQLPVLFAGTSMPSDIYNSAALRRPPYNLPHLGKLWFVSSNTSPAPTTFTVTWDENGNVRYTTVPVTSPKKQ